MAWSVGKAKSLDSSLVSFQRFLAPRGMGHGNFLARAEKLGDGRDEGSLAMHTRTNNCNVTLWSDRGVKLKTKTSRSTAVKNFSEW